MTSWPVRVGFLCLAIGVSLARADELAPPAMPQTPPAQAGSVHEVETYGDADATCLEWSNGCQVCRRQPSGGWACSTPGIACVPEAVTCRGS
jgi:hypothetical protein